MHRARIAVFVGPKGRGSNMQAIARAVQELPLVDFPAKEATGTEHVTLP